MDWLTKVIGWISPEAACRREAWQAQLRSFDYDAADGGRLNADWRTSIRSAEMTDRWGRDIIRSRARDLERNSDVAGSIISAYKRNVIGRGFTLQARTPDEELNRQLETLWKEWTRAHNCDVTGQQSFTQMLRMAVVRKKVDGGMIWHKCFIGGGVLPFKLQALEVDELATGWFTPKNPEKNRVVGGIEYNEFNRPVGFWIKQYQIDGFTDATPVYLDANDVIFYFSKRRPSQVRELSDMAVSMTRIRDENEFITAVSVKERIAACLAVFIRKIVPSSSYGRGGTQVGNHVEYDGKTLTPGMIMELNQGDDVTAVSPGGSSGEADAFLKTMTRMTGAGQGLAYETISRDMSGSTYSSARANIIEDELTYAEEVELLQENVMDEVYQTFILSAILAGRISIKGFWDLDTFGKSQYFAHEWIAARKAWIDPQKEANAQKTALANHLKTFQQIAGENGRDWKDMMRDFKEAQDYAEKIGLTWPGSAAVSGGEAADDKTEGGNANADGKDGGDDGGKEE